MERVLLTGAMGGVGSRMRALLRGRYKELRLSDLRTPERLEEGETFMQADLSDLRQVAKIVEGIDGIVHLGGLPVEHSFDEILQANIVGTYNILESARLAKVKRFVFASSNQVVGFYRRNRRIGADVTVRPSSRYGVSKAFGESLAALYADKHGLRVMCIRIGRVHDRPEDARRLAIWVAPEDLAQLMTIGLEHPDIHYEIVYGVSDNDRAWYDNERAYELGYRPIGKAEEHVAEAMARTAAAASRSGRRAVHGGAAVQPRIRRRSRPGRQVIFGASA